MKTYHLLVLYQGIEMLFWTHRKPDQWLNNSKQLFPGSEFSEVYVSVIEERESRFKNVYDRFGESFEGTFKDFTILIECFGMVKGLLKTDDDGNLIYQGKTIATLIL